MSQQLVGAMDYVGDDFDDLVNQVSGVGAAGNPLRRTKAELGKRAPLGFGNYSLAAAASVSLTARPQRAFQADRLLVTSSQLGVLITSIKVGDEEQILNSSGVPAELYGTSAMADSRPDDFTASPGGIDFTVTLNNTAASTSTGAVGMKGYVKR
jgi:hypothetical protein